MKRNFYGKPHCMLLQIVLNIAFVATNIIIKNILFFLFMFSVLNATAQAHLGSTEQEIRNLHPQNKWKVGYVNNGQRYISSNFVYYFTSATNITDYNIQVPFSLANLNGQVEAYNNKYVITSETSWTAYLEDGGMIYIKLLYDEKNKIRYFSYASTK